MSTTPPFGNTKWDVIIIGAGPVGLLLANLLGQQGRSVLITERRTEPKQNSMAIGITPPSLQLLKSLGLDRTFIDCGIPISSVCVFENKKRLGNVDFSAVTSEYPFILSRPQSETIAILKEHLKKWPSVQYMEGTEYILSKPIPNGIQAQLKPLHAPEEETYDASYLIGCDGIGSTVRKSAGISFSGNRYRARFLMADFTDQTGFASGAHIYFGPNGSVESFPLPNKLRRWIIQTPQRSDAKEKEIGSTIISEVKNRIGMDLSTSELQFESSFVPERFEAATYRKGRIILCGDSAHVMSPIGGQGMNTGFADAGHLAITLNVALNAFEQAETVLHQYAKKRRRAFQYAAPRVALGMWLGTRKGRFLSTCRALFIRYILFRPFIQKRLAAYFTMLTVPDSAIAKRDEPNVA